MPEPSDIENINEGGTDTGKENADKLFNDFRNDVKRRIEEY